MGAFDPLITYTKGSFIGKLIYICAFASKELMCRNGYGQYHPPPSYKCRADEADKVSRKAVITGATNIVLGGKSIIQSGQPSNPRSFYSSELGWSMRGKLISRSNSQRGLEKINSWSTRSNIHGKVLLNRRRINRKTSRKDIQGVRLTFSSCLYITLGMNATKNRWDTYKQSIHFLPSPGIWFRSCRRRVYYRGCTDW